MVLMGYSQCFWTLRPSLLVKVKVNVKVRVLVIALLMRIEQQRFTISEVATDWHELMIPWRIMRPSIARIGKQLDPRATVQNTDISPLQSAH